MRQVVVYRDGNQMAAQIGPDWVDGIAGSEIRLLMQSVIWRIRSPSMGTSCAAIPPSVH